MLNISHFFDSCSFFSVKRPEIFFGVSRRLGTMAMWVEIGGIERGGSEVAIVEQHWLIMTSAESQD
jgi:hypothetical protein